jgi:hypothetical protein
MEAFPEEALGLLNELSREEGMDTNFDINDVVINNIDAMPVIKLGSQIAIQQDDRDEMDSPQLTEREGYESLNGSLTSRTMDLGQSISGLSMGDPVPDFTVFPDELVSNNNYSSCKSITLYYIYLERFQTNTALSTIMAQIPQIKNDQKNEKKNELRRIKTEEKQAENARIKALAESMAAESMASNAVARMIERFRWEAFTLGINQGRIEGMSHGYKLGFSQGRRTQG